MIFVDEKQLLCSFDKNFNINLFRLTSYNIKIAPFPLKSIRVLTQRFILLKKSLPILGIYPHNLKNHESFMK